MTGKTIASGEKKKMTGQNLFYPSVARFTGVGNRFRRETRKINNFVLPTQSRRSLWIGSIVRVGVPLDGFGSAAERPRRGTTMARPLNDIFGR